MLRSRLVSPRWHLVPALVLAVVGSALLGSLARGELVGGGGPAASDCYLEIDMTGATNVQKERTIVCTDGDPCDTGACGDRKCDVEIAACLNQTDPALACTPPAGGLRKANISSKAGTLPALTSSTCGAFVTASIPMKFKKDKYKGPGVLTLKGSATAQKGVKPPKDKDKWVIKCVQRTDACPTTTTSTSSTTTTTLVCGNGAVDPGEDCDLSSAESSCSDPSRPTCAFNCECVGTCTSPTASKLKFTTQLGTDSCGGFGLAKHCTMGTLDPNDAMDGKPCTVDADCDGTPGVCKGGPVGNPPYQGEARDKDGTKLADLSLSCLYLAGGASTNAPSNNPEGSELYLTAQCSPNSIVLTPDAGTGGVPQSNCSLGTSDSAKKCADTSHYGTSCTTDSDCGDVTGACMPEALCYFGPPLEIPNGTASTCVLNVIEHDATANRPTTGVYGVIDPVSGTGTFTVPLSSRVYLTANETQPCPRCVSGACDRGANAGGACTGVGVRGLSVQCPPGGADASTYVGPIPVTMRDITTGSSTFSANETTGLFCENLLPTGQVPGLSEPGALGHAGVRSIVSTGAPLDGDITDMASHFITLAGGFCVPAANNVLIDSIADLPGPAQTSLKYAAQLVP